MKDARRHAFTSRHLILAALALNLLFACLGAHRDAYDTGVHIFLADHYRRSWWNVWETRWYTGFSTASYPPLAQQLVAIVSWPIEELRQLGTNNEEISIGEQHYDAEETAFLIVLMAALATLPFAARDFSRVFVGSRAAIAGGLCACFVPAIALSSWSFGQLPTICALVLILFSTARAYLFLRKGCMRVGCESVAWLAVAAVTHHGSLLLLPWIGGAVIWRAAALRTESYPKILTRVLIWMVTCCAIVSTVSWPFIVWWLKHPLQTPIDHPSRHDFLVDGAARSLFFWPMYGPLILLVPAFLVSAIRGTRFRPLAISFFALFLLGLGGTTRLPWWLFGPSADWLTHDRFALWAAVLLTPYAGAVALRAVRGKDGVRPRWLVPFAAAMVVTVIWAGSSSIIRQKPAAISMTAIARYLAQPSRMSYRFLTLGFGEQMSKLSVIVDNGSIDGNYHTARELRALRTSGLGSLDGAVWSQRGAQGVLPYLDLARDLGTRWALVAHPAYHTVLVAGGWIYRSKLSGVEIWEHPLAKPFLSDCRPSLTAESIWWGIVPISSFIFALGITIRRSQ